MENYAAQEGSHPDPDSSAARLRELLLRRRRYEALDEALVTLPRKLTHQALIPFGPRLYLPGRLVRTNELMVLIGDSQFVEVTAFQAREMVQRRLEVIDKNIEQVTVNKSEFDALKNDRRSQGDEGERAIKTDKSAGESTMKGQEDSSPTCVASAPQHTKRRRSESEREKLTETIMKSTQLARGVAQETGIVNFYEVYDHPDDVEPTRVVFPPSWGGAQHLDKVRTEDVKDREHETANSKEHLNFSGRENGKSLKKVTFAADVAREGDSTESAKANLDYGLLDSGHSLQTREEVFEQLRALELEEEAAEAAEAAKAKEKEHKKQAKTRDSKKRVDSSFLSGLRKGFFDDLSRSSGKKDDTKTGTNNLATSKQPLERNPAAQPGGANKTFNVIERAPPGVRVAEKVMDKGERPPLRRDNGSKPMSMFKQRRLARLNRKEEQDHS